MRTNPQYEEFIENIDNRRMYEQERLLVDATELLATVMDSTCTKRSELAQRLKKSKAHVTQILRGGQNLTLKTLADVFFALNHRLIVVAEPMAAGAGIVLTKQWNVTQRAGNAVVTNDYKPAEEFFGEIAA